MPDDKPSKPQVRTPELAAAQRAYYLAHREELKVKRRAYYHANKQRIIEQQAAYRKSDPARTARRDADYRARTRERQQAHEAQRRSLEYEAFEPVTRAQINEKVALFGGLCAYCGDPWREMDHVVPLARGGRHEIGNMVPACRPCNRSKRAYIYPFEWRGRAG